MEHWSGYVSLAGTVVNLALFVWLALRRDKREDKKLEAKIAREEREDTGRFALEARAIETATVKTLQDTVAVETRRANNYAQKIELMRNKLELVERERDDALRRLEASEIENGRLIREIAKLEHRVRDLTTATDPPPSH